MATLYLGGKITPPLLQIVVDSQRADRERQVFQDDERARGRDRALHPRLRPRQRGAHGRPLHPTCRGHHPLPHEVKEVVTGLG